MKITKTSKRKTPYPIPPLFNKLFNFFSSDTQKNISDVFVLALKLLKYRFLRKQRIYNNTAQKKRKPPRLIRLDQLDMSNIMLIADFRIGRQKTFQAIDKLNLLKKDINEKEALEYLEENVIKTVKDFFGRDFVIDTESMRFLYKDIDGKHVVASENFESSRAKRLPWILPVIQNSSEVYECTEQSWTTYYYVGTFTIPLKGAPNAVNYFFIVGRKKANKPISFITAYTLDTYGKLLKRIEPSRPYSFRRNI